MKRQILYVNKQSVKYELFLIYSYSLSKRLLVPGSTGWFVAGVRRFRNDWMHANIRIINAAGTVIVSFVSSNIIAFRTINWNSKQLSY